MDDALRSYREQHDSKPIEKIVCLGLGPVRDSRAAQLQLALLDLLKGKVSSLAGEGSVQITAYDPIFDEDDWAILAKYDIASSADAEEVRQSHLPDYIVLALTSFATQPARLTADGATLFFMPHCERWLYEKLWTLNEKQGTAKNVLLFGNLHSVYAEK